MVDPEEFHEVDECPTTQWLLNKLSEGKRKGYRVSEALAWDDLTGMSLDAGKVLEARANEVAYIRAKKVYGKIPRGQAMRNGWKIIRTRWIDINKGDVINTNFRSRLVGK